MTGTTIFLLPQGKQAKCWVFDHWVLFRIIPGEYKNILTFLDVHKLFFVAEIEFDPEKVPIEIRGYGTSKTLLQYLANNDNNSLSYLFLLYFLDLMDIRYTIDNKKINWRLLNNSIWQNCKIIVTPSDQIEILYLTCDSMLLSCDDMDVSCDGE